MFENGDAELAVELLENNGMQGFERWRRKGGNNISRVLGQYAKPLSQSPYVRCGNHILFKYLLGIDQKENTCGYRSLVINPLAVSKFDEMSGSMKIPSGVVSVGYKRENGKIKFKINIPENTEAVFCGSDSNIDLCCGENIFELMQADL